MNSLPSFLNGNQVTAMIRTATRIIVFGKRNTNSMRGRYDQMKKRFSGFFCSFGILPRMKKVMSTGMIVMASTEDAAMANVFVYARGRNSLPS